MQRTIPPPHKRLRFIFDDEWQPLVRLEEYHRSRLGITKARDLAEEQRQLHYAQGSNRDSHGTWHGRFVFDWLQTLPQNGSTSATELYEDFLNWMSEWTDADPAEFTQTRWGRIMNHWVSKRRTNSGIVYDGISLL